MNFVEAVTEVRRRLGIINPFSYDDFMWLVERSYLKNKELFDRLARDD